MNCPSEVFLSGCLTKQFDNILAVISFMDPINC